MGTATSFPPDHAGRKRGQPNPRQTHYADWTEFSKATQAYIRRRNRDHHDPRIAELENRRKVA